MEPHLSWRSDFKLTLVISVLFEIPLLGFDELEDLGGVAELLLAGLDVDLTALRRFRPSPLDLLGSVLVLLLCALTVDDFFISLGVVRRQRPSLMIDYRLLFVKASETNGTQRIGELRRLQWMINSLHTLKASVR